jgi:hypothetical protein
MAGVEAYRYCAYLHDPHSELELEHPDAEVYIVVGADILLHEEDDMPTIFIRNVKVYDELYSEDWDAPTSEQLMFWDLELRILAEYIRGERECHQCGCKLKLHVEIHADEHTCTVTNCACRGHISDLDP